MKREFLRGLGVEEDNIQKILDEHHDSLKDYREKAEKTDSLKEELENANSEIKERDQQITTLQSKVGDNEELKSELEKYKEENEKYDSKMKELQLNSAVKLAVAKEANDANDILAFINKDELELQEDGEVKGLKEAVKLLKESKPYLFAETKPTGSSPKEGKSVTGGITQEQFDNMTVSQRTELYINDKETYEKLVN
ncbi:phage scaffolding protein [Staphylococcus pseudintermedius]|uniref:phage scaffolding protein n=1 Tax=Staphylococcus pseudintermedius TaxID=283734 RepID=UPI000BBBEBAA|nr:phage scaffolding protein [Staphylococcus pseudintermedius]EGQ3676823.1 hypothetical protein [Staphylococcus pseudintermedius]EIS6282738.1 phage scaffolding protein [Staphylococcus pseudintermedius]EJA1926834.1 phage scaffolding protein [Staphylococcus pseudintermedius]EJD8462181.1 phage scaffolding protein [Staphylococcus pseudintermedius]ELH1731754.1 phage scaffolding protein [Staphylococcus pseudintermedius]